MSHKLGRYDVETVIGRGGMGVVYRARDPYLDRAVAIKVLTAERVAAKSWEQLKNLFLREARAAAKLAHPNIVTVYDVGVGADKKPYLVMELIEGPTLARMLKDEGPMEPAVVARIGQELGNALAAAHEADLVHRDVKPANALRSADGTIKLMDFGLAWIADSNLATGKVFFGSPIYSSPEQIRGEKLDHRSDLFSLGLTLFMLLTGTHPFSQDQTDVKKTMYQIAHQPPTTPSQARDGLDAEWDTVLLKAMAREPGDRYPDAASMSLALADIARAAGAMYVVGGSQLELVVVRGPDEGRRLMFGEEATVGRLGSADLTLRDPTVDGEHCTVAATGDRVTVRDLGTTAGTWVDGQRVSELEVAPGDTFKVGAHTTIRIERRDDASPSTATTMPAIQIGEHDVLTTLVDSAVAAPSNDKRRRVGGIPHFALVVEEGPKQGKRLAVRDTLILTRATGPGSLEDPKVSRKHAVVEVGGRSRVFIRDLASTNGTWVDGQRIREVELRIGDRVKVGSSVLGLERAASD